MTEDEIQAMIEQYAWLHESRVEQMFDEMIDELESRTGLDANTIIERMNGR